MYLSAVNFGNFNRWTLAGFLGVIAQAVEFREHSVKTDLIDSNSDSELENGISL